MRPVVLGIWNAQCLRTRDVRFRHFLKSRLIRIPILAKDVVQKMSKMRWRGPSGLGRWSYILRSCRMAGSNSVAARTRDPPYHRGFGECMIHMAINER